MAWYTAGSGATCVAAYDFVGASSLADSYINEANPGTFNCAPGVAPTWAYGTGVTFNGTTQYLTTGVIPDGSYSMIARFSGGSTSVTPKCLAGATNAAFTARMELFPFYDSSGVGGRRIYAHSNSLAFNPAALSGVVAVAGTAMYLNGAAEVGSLSGGASAGVGVFIGARNANGTPLLFAPCNVQALAIYSGTLSASDVVAITTAMNALPTVAAKGLPVIAHHHRQIFGG